MRRFVYAKELAHTSFYSNIIQYNALKGPFPPMVFLILVSVLFLGQTALMRIVEDYEDADRSTSSGSRQSSPHYISFPGVSYAIPQPSFKPEEAVGMGGTNKNKPENTTNSSLIIELGRQETTAGSTDHDTEKTYYIDFYPEKEGNRLTLPKEIGTFSENDVLVLKLRKDGAQLWIDQSGKAAESYPSSELVKGNAGTSVRITRSGVCLVREPICIPFSS